MTYGATHGAGAWSPRVTRTSWELIWGTGGVGKRSDGLGLRRVTEWQGGVRGIYQCSEILADPWNISIMSRSLAQYRACKAQSCLVHLGYHPIPLGSITCPPPLVCPARSGPVRHFAFLTCTPCWSPKSGTEPRTRHLVHVNHLLCLHKVGHVTLDIRAAHVEPAAGGGGAGPLVIVLGCVDYSGHIHMAGWSDWFTDMGNACLHDSK